MNWSKTRWPVIPDFRCKVSAKITVFNVNDAFVEVIVESLPSGV